MKTAALFVSGLVLSALASGPVAAEIVRVKLTARVTEVTDTGGLEGKVVVGQRVNGTYVYNTNTPNLAPFPGLGTYHPYANEARMRFAVGGLVFESAQPTQGIEISVYSESFAEGQFTMTSQDNKPLPDDTVVDSIAFDLRGSGNMTQSEALANAAPVLGDYWTKEVMIGGGSFFVRASIEAAELIVPVALEVSPASGSFVANQHFDAAVILPRNSVVANAHALANGMLLPLTYPGNCQLQPQVGAGRPSLLCPGAEAALANAAGAPIEWTVELTNGTILTETVNWAFAQ
jgi:hypothetical protein